MLQHIYSHPHHMAATVRSSRTHSSTMAQPNYTHRRHYDHRLLLMHSSVVTLPFNNHLPPRSSFSLFLTTSPYDVASFMCSRINRSIRPDNSHLSRPALLIFAAYLAIIALAYIPTALLLTPALLPFLALLSLSLACAWVS